MTDKRIILYQSDAITARVGVNCKHIEKIRPDVFHIYGLAGRDFIQVYGGSGVIVEFEEGVNDEG